MLIVASLSGAVAGVGAMLVNGISSQSGRVVRRLGWRALPIHLRRTARRTAIPFGPFLALGALVALYAPDVGLPWQFRING